MSAKLSAKNKNSLEYYKRQIDHFIEKKGDTGLTIEEAVEQIKSLLEITIEDLEKKEKQL